MTDPVSSVAKHISRRGENPASMVPGVVVQVGGLLTVDLAGESIPPGNVWWDGGWTPVVGDSCVVLRQGAEAWVFRPFTRNPRPSQGSIISLGAGQTASVLINGLPVTCLYEAPYSPAVSDVVILDWQSSQPVVRGKIGSIPPPAPPTGPVQVPGAIQSGVTSYPAIQSDSFRSGWRGDDDVIQGTAPGYPGANSGAWFYGDAPRQLAGATVVSARIWMRGESAGVSSPAVHLYRHTSNIKPAGDVTRVAGPHDVVRGQREASWATIPAAYAQAIVDSGGGIGITGSPYARLAGIVSDGQSGTLEITWRR